MQEPTIINVLVERDGDWWVAHCLQINLATQARTLGELHVEIERIITDHLETCQELGTNPFEMAAPQRFWDKYKATQVETSFVNHERARMRQAPHVETRIAA